MRTHKILLLSIGFLSIFVLSSSGVFSFYDNIFINNEVIDSKEPCNLKLEYNDVVKITGVTSPDNIITVRFDEEVYTSSIDEYGNWLLLFSIPYIEDGEYEINGISKSEGGNKLLCTIRLGDGEINEEDTSEQQESNIWLYVLISLFVLSIVTWGIISKIWKKKRR